VLVDSSRLRVGRQQRTTQSFTRSIFQLTQKYKIMRQQSTLSQHNVVKNCYT